MQLSCSVCGSDTFSFRGVLWPKLINEWQLSPAEVDYIDRQQGQCCTNCGANLRSIALSDALLPIWPGTKTLMQAVQAHGPASVTLLEINQAGTLHTALKQLSGHVFAQYPDVDMHALPYEDDSFDVVVHSDTLEHVENPLHALKECRRVLKKGGLLAFTVPVIVGRLTRQRGGLPKSFHGDPAQGGDDYVVHTEFGADAWTYPLLAGFLSVTIHSVQFPAALAIAARK